MAQVGQKKEKVVPVKDGGGLMYDIKLCLSCEIATCNPTSVRCPHRRQDSHIMRNVYDLIYRHPLSTSELRKITRIKIAELKEMLARLEKAKLIKQKDGEWVRR